MSEKPYFDEVQVRKNKEELLKSRFISKENKKMIEESLVVQPDRLHIIPKDQPEEERKTKEREAYNLKHKSLIEGIKIARAEGNKDEVERLKDELFHLVISN